MVDKLEIKRVHIVNVKNMYQSSDLGKTVGVDHVNRNTQCSKELPKRIF